MIKQIFLQLGFSEKEYFVYEVLLKIGVASSSQIARELDIPRQTVYTLTQNLIKEGLVDLSDKKGVKHFFADPDNLLSFIEKRKKTLEKNQEDVKKEISQKFLTKKQNKSFPKIAYFEGEDGLKRLFLMILEQYKKGERGVFRGYGINTIHGLLHEYIPDFIKERHNLGVETHIFIGQGVDDFEITGDKNAYGRIVKRLNIKPQVSGLYIIGNRIYLFSYQDLVGVMLENQAMADLLSSVFDERWGMTK